MTGLLSVCTAHERECSPFGAHGGGVRESLQEQFSWAQLQLKSLRVGALSWKERLLERETQEYATER